MKIKFEQKVTIEDSVALSELNELLKNETNFQTKVQTEYEKDAKAELQIAIDIISLSISGLSLLLTILSYWNSKHPKYNITFKVGNKEFTKDNITEEDFNREIDSAREFSHGNPEIILKTQ